MGIYGIREGHGESLVCLGKTVEILKSLHNARLEYNTSLAASFPLLEFLSELNTVTAPGWEGF
jgi:hypothetical protein